jgi:hypothetical protein
MKMLVEEWKPVKGFPGYDVSSCGRVRRGDLMLIQGTKETGYRRVSLTKNGKQFRRYAHVLVAEAFVGSRPDGTEVNHIDGNKANNTPANLEYVTHAENVRHAHEAGLCKYGEQAGTSKYTEQQVRRAHELVAAGWKYREAAKETGLHYSFVCDLCSGRAWKHLNLPVIYRNKCGWRLEKV